jgi:hypothetical protein
MSTKLRKYIYKLKIAAIKKIYLKLFIITYMYSSSVEFDACLKKINNAIKLITFIH